MARQAVLPFNGGAKNTHSSAVRGGKGAGLAQMADLGLPVPPGFTMGTGVSRAFMENGCLPRRVFSQLVREIQKLEKITGRTFGDPDNPLLVSVRSGAQISMPGMMDTILNVGLDPCDISGLKRMGGKRFACDTRDRFIAQWQTTFDEDPRTSETLRSAYYQLWLAIRAVLKSWNSERAQAYRAQHSIPNYWGTAVTVQAMVFGNIDHHSCTGVVFGANVTSGESGLYGEFLPRAQGEDVVSGVHTPLSIADMKAWNPKLYRQLEEHVRTLETYCGDIVDVEFTVEKGVLYILQYRKAKRSLLAQVIWAVHDVWNKRITKPQALARVSASEVVTLRKPSLSQRTVNSATVTVRGLAASPGAATGVIALTSEQAQQFASRGWSVILVRQDTSPDDLPGMLASQAIVTANGGATSHAAVVARELGLPAVVGANFAPGHFIEGTPVSVDGSRGLVLLSQLPLEKVDLCKEVNLFFKWWDLENGYTPRIGFEWHNQQLSANVHLNDFYLSEMMAQRCIGTSLENRSRALRNRIHREVAESFALYLLMAIAGEARHFNIRLGRPLVTPGDIAAMQRVNAVVDSSGFDDEKDRVRLHKLVAKTLKDAPHETIVDYIQNIHDVFGSDVWEGGLFGGRKWAAITNALLMFMKGELSLTLFVDHVFDLEHNGGRLFNKNPLFSSKTWEQAKGGNGVLERQLDVKKNISHPDRLFAQLSGLAEPSPQVVELWEVVKKEVM